MLLQQDASGRYLSLAKCQILFKNVVVIVVVSGSGNNSTSNNNITILIRKGQEMYFDTHFLSGIATQPEFLQMRIVIFDYNLYTFPFQIFPIWRSSCQNIYESILLTSAEFIIQNYKPLIPYTITALQGIMSLCRCL